MSTDEPPTESVVGVSPEEESAGEEEEQWTQVSRHPPLMTVPRLRLGDELHEEAVCCRSSISDAKNLEEAAAIPCREKLLLPSVFVHLLGSLIGYHR